jgi:hypothetical protein
MKAAVGGCVGCLAICALLFVVTIVIVAIGSTSRPSNSDEGHAITFSHPIHSKKHGWITAKSSVDLWAFPSALCNAIEAGANEIIAAQREGREPDTHVGQREGWASLDNGVRVLVLGHAHADCPGPGGAISLTRVRVSDRDSPVNGRVGYITEGLLSHQ